MEFIRKGEGVEERRLDAVERELGIRLPSALRDLFLEADGGVLVASSFVSEVLETGVELLPLDDALRAYRTLALQEKVLSRNQFPFGVDPGGDYWVVDCSSANAEVAFVAGGGEDEVIPAGVCLGEFLKSLTSD